MFLKRQRKTEGENRGREQKTADPSPWIYHVFVVSYKWKCDLQEYSSCIPATHAWTITKGLEAQKPVNASLYRCECGVASARVCMRVYVHVQDGRACLWASARDLVWSAMRESWPHAQTPTWARKEGVWKQREWMDGLIEEKERRRRWRGKAASSPTHWQLNGWMDGWMDRWMDGGITEEKNLKKEQWISHDTVDLDTVDL